MKIIKPPKLKKGDLIGIVAPASPPKSLENLNKGIRYLEQLGYRIEIGKHIYDKYGYLAGGDKERAKDLNDLFANPKVKAIFNVRGGFGSCRILNFLDYNSIKKNPKIFVGYSDITAIQLALFRKAGLVTFSGPMVATDFSNKINPDSEEFFWRCITSSKVIGKIPDHFLKKSEVIKSGKSSGVLIGGNLSIITSLVGTAYFPSFSKSILIMEEIEEAPYRIDRMLHQLKLSGKLKNIAGVILGDFSTCVPEKSKPSLNLKQIIEQVFNNYPVLSNVGFGHFNKSLTFPFGIRVYMDAGKKVIRFIEGAVV